jgi:hypothetical protein
MKQTRPDPGITDGATMAKQGQDGQGADEGAGPQYVDEDHEELAYFLEKWFDEDERPDVEEHLMTRKGYTRIQGWGPRADPDPQPEPDPEPEPGAAGPSKTGRPGSRRKPAYFKR